MVLMSQVCHDHCSPQMLNKTIQVARPHYGTDLPAHCLSDGHCVSGSVYMYIVSNTAFIVITSNLSVCMHVYIQQCRWLFDICPNKINSSTLQLNLDSFISIKISIL